MYHGRRVQNFELARLFYEMATLLEVRNESVFRVRAYQRAAQMLESLTEDIAAVAARGGLQKLPGIGKDLAVRVEEFLHTGRIDQLEAMRRDVPPRFLTLLEIRGLGPRTAKLLWDRLGVDSVERLEELCRTKEILNVAGIREKTCENILKGIAIWRAGRTRTLLPAARAVAEQVASALRAHGGVERLEVAGSLRRMRETVKDVDILVTSTEPARVIETLTSLPSVTEVIARGDTKVSVRHQDGLQVDLRVVEPSAFGAALQYFTGSKDHNVRVRELAKRRGLTISEYGVFEEKSGTRVAGETEDEVYAAVGLPWIPPELRENTGEIDAARNGGLPELITADRIRGDLHAHTDWSDGHLSLEKLVTAAEDRGYEYIAVSDHSRSDTIAGGLSIDELRAQIQQIRQLQASHRIRILAASECAILADGTMDFPDEVLDELDVVLAAVHSRFKQTREEMTTRIVRALGHPKVHILAHPTGRRLGSRDPYDVDMEAVFAAARQHGKALEINASPERLDLADVHARRAAELGIPIAINTDTHYLNNFDNLALGVAVARRAWIGPSQVLNARPLAELVGWTQRARSA
ncbi:MAG: DNA polymerase/3'-5' exonuclease PolX [Candidatus Rokuibacteriota bacterium]|nr:MAG: DNA polymerase/3'-5' exonuclease PolX [Candidatus Rokubacteria bacterium]